MIFSLRGTVGHCDDESCVIEAGGIGFLLTATPSLLSQASVGEEMSAYCVVGNEFQSLYGFLTLQERSLFSLLTTVPRIGPKMAMKIMSRVGVDDIAGLILLQDEEGLSKRAGIGAKTASKVILELSEKLKGSSIPSNTQVSTRIELEEVLLGLGYDKRQVQEVCKESEKFSGSFEKKVKEALSLLAKNKQL